MVNRLLKDESGQTMLEHVVIVVFVVVVAIVGFRLIKGTVSRSTKRASYAIEGRTGHWPQHVEPHYIDQ